MANENYVRIEPTKEHPYGQWELPSEKGTVVIPDPKGNDITVILTPGDAEFLNVCTAKDKFNRQGGTHTLTPNEQNILAQTYQIKYNNLVDVIKGTQNRLYPGGLDEMPKDAPIPYTG